MTEQTEPSRWVVGRTYELSDDMDYVQSHTNSLHVCGSLHERFISLVIPGADMVCFALDNPVEFVFCPTCVLEYCQKVGVMVLCLVV